MNKTVILLLAATILASAGCARNIAVPATVKRVALVQFINDHRMALMNFDQMDSYDRAMNATYALQIESIETRLKARWSVVPVTDFITDPEYHRFAVSYGYERYHTPMIKNKHMPIITYFKNTGSLKRETAARLCALLKVDAVMLVSSSWGMREFFYRLFPYALTHVTLYDSRGQRIFHDKKYKTSQEGQGSFVARVDENTQRLWVRLTGEGLDDILKKFTPAEPR